MRIETDLHHDGPDVDTKVENSYDEETELGTTTLRDALQVKNETKAEATNYTEEGRDKRRQGTSSDREVSTEIGRPRSAVEEGPDRPEC